MDIFYTNKNDNTVIINNGKKEYTFCDIKKQIAWQIENIKNKKQNVVILSGNNYSFIIHFFASIFAKKNIYLLSDKSRLNDLGFDFDVLDESEFGEIDNYAFPKIDTKEALFNFFTSGSTGKPKTIVKSLYNVIFEAKDIIEEFNLQNKLYNVMCTTTMCHSFCLSYMILFFLYEGFKIYTPIISYPDTIDKEDCILVSTPTFLSSIPKHNIQFKIPPEYIFSAGSKLDDNVFAYLKKQSKVVNIYGCTEVGVISYNTEPKAPLKLFKSVNVKANENNIIVNSPYGYLENTVINDKIELNNREMIIKNRTDRLFKIYDKCVSADELENKLKNNELVNDCYIIQYNGRLAILCALSDKGKDFLLNNNISMLIKTLKQYLLKYSEIIPQRWKFIDMLPMTLIGKVNKKLINKIFNVNISLPIILDRKITETSITYKIYFYNKCNFFNGHFPEFKLVPGVVQLYYAKEFANAHFEINVGEGQWKRIKFSNVIKPDSIVFLKIEKNDKTVKYEYYSDTKQYSSGVFLCENVLKELKNEFVSI